MKQRAGQRVFPFGPAGRSGDGLKALIASAGHKTRHKGKQGQPCLSQKQHILPMGYA